VLVLQLPAVATLSLCSSDYIWS